MEGGPKDPIKFDELPDDVEQAFLQYIGDMKISEEQRDLLRSTVYDGKIGTLIATLHLKDKDTGEVQDHTQVVTINPQEGQKATIEKVMEALDELFVTILGKVPIQEVRNFENYEFEFIDKTTIH